MRKAGAVILGKTNVPILSHTGSHANGGWAGSTYNSAGREFLPGGSSAGTATAVGGNFCVLGLAEETGGSIQNPAAAQGLVGIKPTFGLVPNVGVMPLSSLRDVVGPDRPLRAGCGPDTRCAVRLHDRGSENRRRASAAAPRAVTPRSSMPRRLNGKRIGLYGPGWRTLPLSEETTALYKSTQNELVKLGAELVADPFAGSGFVDLRKPSIPGAEYRRAGSGVDLL